MQCFETWFLLGRGKISMLQMRPFELLEPRSLREAIAALEPEDARPVSGGTAVMLMMKAGVLRPSRLVSLRRLGLDDISLEKTGELRVGAMTTLRALEKSEVVKKGWPVITRALRTLSNVRVRNVATLGGHLAHGDPHTDLPPLLSALGATVTLSGPAAERSLPAHEPYPGYLATTPPKGELLPQVQGPALGEKRA